MDNIVSSLTKRYNEEVKLKNEQYKESIKQIEYVKQMLLNFYTQNTSFHLLNSSFYNTANNIYREFHYTSDSDTSVTFNDTIDILLKANAELHSEGKLIIKHSEEMLDGYDQYRINK